jgi:hypothetical protein
MLIQAGGCSSAAVISTWTQNLLQVLRAAEIPSQVPFRGVAERFYKISAHHASLRVDRLVPKDKDALSTRYPSFPRRLSLGTGMMTESMGMFLHDLASDQSIV